MKKISPHNSKLKSDKGFTLIEMLIVIGILAVLSSIPLFMNINSYRGEAFRGEQSALGIALQTARANSFNNINQKKHGVAIAPGGFEGYVIFEGNTYATRDALMDQPVAGSYKVSFSSTTPNEIVFDQLSGNANYNGDITMLDGERGMEAEITINHEGKISW